LPPCRAIRLFAWRKHHRCSTPQGALSICADHCHNSMFKEPDEGSPTQTAAKIDRTAASSRSPIRRERTVRAIHRQFPSTERVGRRSRNAVPADLPFPPHRDDFGAVSARSHSSEGRRWSTMTDNVRYGDAEATDHAYRRSAGEELLRDALQHERPGRRMRIPRESSLRFEMTSNRSQHPSASPEHSLEDVPIFSRPYMPSPPSSFDDNTTSSRRRRSPNGPLDIVQAEPTPGFAPAQGFRPHNQEHQAVMARNLPRNFTPPGEDSWTASYPPLRRVGHLSPRPGADVSSSGGLGDRRRSLSPSTSEEEHDTWDTLLTTMEPDTNLPSADSSFTTATASHSARQSRHPSQIRSSRLPSTAPATQPVSRESSRSATPTLLNAAYRRTMHDINSSTNMSINHHEYADLSEDSRDNMSAMLDVVRQSRNLRSSNPDAVTERIIRETEDELLYHYLDRLQELDEANIQLVRMRAAQANAFSMPSFSARDGMLSRPRPGQSSVDYLAHADRYVRRLQ
jgi:hypothetical protein